MANDETTSRLAAEAEAIQTVGEVLESLAPDARRRVVLYVSHALSIQLQTPVVASVRQIVDDEADPVVGVVSVVAELGEGAKAADVAARLHIPVNVARSRLERAVKAGELRRISRGRYAA